MKLLVSGGYVAAACSLVAALSFRGDRVLLARLPVRSTRRRSFLREVGRRSPFPAAPTLAARASGLGLTSEQVDRIRGRKLLLGFAGAALGLPPLMVAGGIGAIAMLILSFTGYRLPDFELARVLEGRRRRHLVAVPELLDVLAVSVSAGLSPRLALDRAPEVVGGELGDALRRARDEVALGSPWRTELRRTAVMIDSPELRRLAVTLERSERLGTPLGERLQSLASEVRDERRARREERARRAPIQMLFPLVLLILPAFVVAAVVPAVISATRGLA